VSLADLNNRDDGQSDKCFLGIVEAAEGTTPGPASAMSYDVVINNGSAIGRLRFEGMVPQLPRWPDEVPVIRHPPGQIVQVQRSRGIYYLLTPELPAVVECEEVEPEEEPE
jgi:hypothetical protein